MANRQFRLIDLIDDICDGKDVFFHSVRVVRDMMTYDVKVLTLDDTVETCLKIMKENKIRHIPVVDIATEETGKQYFVGIVSQRDLLRQISPYLGKVGEKDSDLKALKLPLGQIVTRHPKSVSPETKIKDMIAIMVDNHIDSVPVLLDGDLVGIATVTDILKLFARLDAIGKICREKTKVEPSRRFVDLLSGDSDHAALALSSVLQTVKDIMTEQVVCLAEQDNLAKVMEVMQEGKFRHVPIVDKQNRLVGIISDRDVLQHLPFHRRQCQPQTNVFRYGLFDVDLNEPAIRQPVNRIMKRDITHVPPTCSFYDAVEMLHQMSMSCLPVTDEEEKLLGIVTVTDVMRGLLVAYTLFEKAMV
ncbi:MAG: CBS domain-containing protein [Planctomycetota bacterium]|jgi:acetoin utilization protein AcuB